MNKSKIEKLAKEHEAKRAGKASTETVESPAAGRMSLDDLRNMEMLEALGNVVQASVQRAVEAAIENKLYTLLYLEAVGGVASLSTKTLGGFKDLSMIADEVATASKLVYERRRGRSIAGGRQA